MVAVDLFVIRETKIYFLSQKEKGLKKVKKYFKLKTLPLNTL